MDRRVMDQFRAKPKRSGFLCYHCHKEIKGQIYWDDERPYDPYCWQFRFVLRESEKAIRGPDGYGPTRNCK